MNPSNKNISRRDTLIWGGGFLIALASGCKKEPTAEDSEKIRTLILNQQQALNNLDAKSSEQAKAAVEAERNSLTKYYGKQIDELKASLTKQKELFEGLLKARAADPAKPLTPDEQSKITTAATETPPTPPPPPPQTPTDNNPAKDKTAQTIMMGLMLALAIAFPEFAGVAALFAAASSGMDEKDTKEFVNGVVGGEGPVARTRDETGARLSRFEEALRSGEERPEQRHDDSSPHHERCQCCQHTTPADPASTHADSSPLPTPGAIALSDLVLKDGGNRNGKAEQNSGVGISQPS